MNTAYVSDRTCVEPAGCTHHALGADELALLCFTLHVLVTLHPLQELLPTVGVLHVLDAQVQVLPQDAPPEQRKDGCKLS